MMTDFNLSGVYFGSPARFACAQVTSYLVLLILSQCNRSSLLFHYVGMHCVMTTIFISVLGPGLALHGPQGSMAKAANGMRLEVEQVFLAFNVMVMSFAISVLASCWVLMDFQSAITSTAILCICSYFWYRTCKRIVNRFQYTITHSELDFDASDHAMDACTGDDSYAVDETAGRLPNNVTIHTSCQNNFNTNTNNNLTDTHCEDHASSTTSPTQPHHNQACHTHKGGFLSSLVKHSHATETGHRREADLHSHESSAPAPVAGTIAAEPVVTEGYLTYNEEVNSAGKELWKRRYCVIGKSGALFFYENKDMFREAPGKPLKNRPIDLKSHGISVAPRKGGDPFAIHLTPTDPSMRSWVIKCDSAEELEMWVQSFRLLKGATAV
jgi:hypothetical protein